jgi:hypothetical protein
MAFRPLDFVWGQDEIRFKSGANNSWLEATPTSFINHFPLYILSAKDMWERHLAAIFGHFEADLNAALGQFPMLGV